MTLREKAQEWLKNYKGAGNAYGGNILSLEEMAAIVAEYLRATAPYVKVESTNTETAKATSERIKALQGKAELLHGDLVEEQDKAAELEKRIKELEFQLDGAERRVCRLEGENSAYRFAIRCNGVSGAEVDR